MARLSTVLAALAAVLVAAACGDAPVAPAGTARLRADAATGPAVAPGLGALTWNVYVGAEIERVVAARSPEEAILIATQEWAGVQATDFPARAGALAAAIAARAPQFVGLEELALYRTTDRPFDQLATHVAYDFLQLVLDSLHARGLDYVPAAVDRTTDIQVPVIAGFDASGAPLFQGVRFTDGNALLVRGDVPYANPRSGVYTAHQSVTIGDVATGVYEGWGAVDAVVGGTTYAVVVTHLAGQEVADIQLAETTELLGMLAAEGRPTILMGDFNSDAYGVDPTRATPTYGMVRAAGFGDSWSDPDREAPGLTCCEQADLLNPLPTLDQRIDFVFTRNLPAGAVAVSREVVGDRPGDRMAGGLWPSDHAGLAARFLVPAAATGVGP